MNLDRTRTKNIEWLKQRTIHVRGLTSVTKRGKEVAYLVVGETLKKFLDNKLISAGVSGKVVDVVTVPDLETHF